ncbi:urea ABC transporter permease subunit UrtC [Beijerinckia indica]|uniref:Urea ABC transporter, permease protein UrtC n=1 Tax=Beijerinckia indica subsp. indica (strain ATCC 9039 / DSM 1715 / NCIMB 8712) TaxID=395963 RepID=B2II39_BEII9|nr:urea ABC transporter permease subunit UrtC [Beijerinckia indica]ACB94622.1 urea ABC transporter, permease protein UrtC [Beijerinckia indica subsp. indica ATCC 9039]
MTPFDRSFFLARKDIVGIVILSALLIVILPLALDSFRLQMVGKYLTYAFVALGLVLCWGYAGILSLGQGIFFGLGGYCMAMYLKLEASSVENTKIQSTPGIPDFMDWNQLTELPYFWRPFHSFGFTTLAIVAVPAIFAGIIGFAMFKRRVGGVYFSIITQAIASILTILIIGQQGYTGGINGITDLRTLHGWDIRTDAAKSILYFVCVGLLLASILLAYYVKSSKLGRILVAMRDKEDRVRFSGYDVANFKVFIFCLSAILSAIGGAMFTLQVGFMSPSFVGTVPSIEMVIYCAVGGRLSLLGAVYGTLLVSWAKTSLSESFPELWLFGLGGLFIAVVLVFPNGLAGLYQTYVAPHLGKVFGLKPKTPSGAPAVAE